MNTGISPRVISEIRLLAQKYNLDKVILFGSRARGDFQEKSDIDLAIIGGDFIRFSLDIEDTTWTLLKYDVVNLEQELSPELRNSIEREGVLLYEKI